MMTTTMRGRATGEEEEDKASPISGHSSIAVTRLAEERKQWRRDHPFGFYARPSRKADGTLDLMTWECGVPGRSGGLWDGGLYTCALRFPPSYPMSPPTCTFTPSLPHPNVFTSGAVCLSILSYDWRPSITLKQILIGVQELLDNPNPKSPANGQAYELFRLHRQRYEDCVRKFADKMRPLEETHGSL